MLYNNKIEELNKNMSLATSTMPRFKLTLATTNNGSPAYEAAEVLLDFSNTNQAAHKDITNAAQILGALPTAKEPLAEASTPGFVTPEVAKASCNKQNGITKLHTFEFNNGYTATIPSLYTCVSKKKLKLLEKYEGVATKLLEHFCRKKFVGNNMCKQYFAVGLAHAPGLT